MVCTTIATRGGCRTQHANSEQGAGRPRITTPSQNHKKARGWHTNREGERAILVSHLAILCRDPKRLRAVLELRHEEGADHNGLGQRFGATVRHNLSARPSCARLRAVLELRHEEGADQTGIQSEAPHSVTGGFSNGRVPYTGLDTTA